MDDERDIELGKVLSGALGRYAESRTPDFRAVYAEAGRRQGRKQGRRQAVLAGIPIAAAILCALTIPIFMKAGLSGTGDEKAYGMEISDLSARTISDPSWEAGVFQISTEKDEGTMGEFVNDLWNL